MLQRALLSECLVCSKRPGQDKKRPFPQKPGVLQHSLPTLNLGGEGGKPAPLRLTMVVILSRPGRGLRVPKGPTGPMGRHFRSRPRGARGPRGAISWAAQGAQEEPMGPKGPPHCPRSYRGSGWRSPPVFGRVRGGRSRPAWAPGAHVGTHAIGLT